MRQEGVQRGLQPKAGGFGGDMNMAYQVALEKLKIIVH